MNTQNPCIHVHKNACILAHTHTHTHTHTNVCLHTQTHTNAYLHTQTLTHHNAHIELYNFVSIFSYLHAKQIIHRDLKSNSILLSLY